MAAVTAIKSLDKRGNIQQKAFPVASGEYIYQGALACVLASSGYLVNFTSTVAAANTAALIGFVADPSYNNNLTAPSSNGSISGTSEKASDISNNEYTVRNLWVSGEFRIDAASGLTQANVGDILYASDNNTFNVSGNGMAVGTITKYISATVCWVDLNVFSYGVNAKVLKGAITAATTTTGGDAISLTFGRPVAVMDFLIDVTTAATGVATMDIGVAANGTTSSDTLLDAVDVGSAAIFASASNNGGTNGKPVRKLTSTQYITGTPSATLAGLVGSYYAVYVEL